MAHRIQEPQKSPYLAPQIWAPQSKNGGEEWEISLQGESLNYLTAKEVAEEEEEKGEGGVARGEGKNEGAAAWALSHWILQREALNSLTLSFAFLAL